MVMKIKEVADQLNISPRAIRFYEDKGLLAPMKDEQSNYRLFTEADARRLKAIISLREIGISVEEIKMILGECDKGDTDELLYSLQLQRSAMFLQLVQLKQNIETTDRMIDHLQKSGSFVWQTCFELAKGLKKVRDLRFNWHDSWDFDGQALIHDQLVYQHQEEFNKHPNYRQVLQTMVEWVDPNQRERGLDIGTGTGNLAAQFLKKGITMAAIDQSKEMLKQCAQKFPELETKLGNFLALPYLDHSFDFVVTSYAFHHLTDEQKILALQEMQRVLKPHGRICIADLMFENENKRETFLRSLKLAGKTEIIHEIEAEYYADCSKLLHWFDKHGYVTNVHQLNELVHLIYAKRVS